MRINQQKALLSESIRNDNIEADNKRLREALSQCKSELMSIHMQHGDEAHAAEMSAGIRMAQAATAHTADGKAAHHD